MRFRLWQKIIRQPPIIEESPGNSILSAESLSEGFAGGAVEGWLEGMGFDIADPFGGDETFAVG